MVGVLARNSNQVVAPYPLYRTLERSICTGRLHLGAMHLRDLWPIADPFEINSVLDTGTLNTDFSVATERHIATHRRR